jgi:O-antigen/teichoic acid export membrane protein
MLKKLLFNSSVYYCSNILQSSLKFILLPILVHYLSVEEYGTLGFVNIFTMFFSVVLFMGFDRGIAREYFDHCDVRAKLQRYLVNIVFFMSAWALVLAVMALSAGRPLYDVFFRSIHVPFYPYVPLALAISALTVFYGMSMVVFQVQQKPFLFAMIQLSKVALFVSFTYIYVARMKAGVYGALMADLVATAVVDILICLLLVSVVKFEIRKFGLILGKSSISAFGRLVGYIDPMLIRGTFMLSLPFLLLDAGSWLLTGVGRICLTTTRSLSEVGLYTFSETIAVVLNVFMAAFYSAYMPYFFRLAARRQENVKALFAFIGELYVLVIGIILATGLLFTRELLLLFAKNYVAAVLPVQILLSSMFFMGLYLIVTLPIIFLKKTMLLPLFFVAVGAVNILLNLALTPTFGVVGTSLAKACAYGIMLIVAYAVAQRQYPIRYNFGAFWGGICALVFLGLWGSSLPVPWRVLLLSVMLAALLSWLYVRWRRLEARYGFNQLLQPEKT